MIPKVIHYCWFGSKPLPKYAKKNIESWKKFFPEFEIKEWNENNFDINLIPYTSQSYKQKKYAFVSDFARYWILYDYGGLYFDTDVEIIKSFEDIVERGPFLGIEKSINNISVNPGLCMGGIPRISLYKKMIDFYSSIKINLEEPVKPYLVNMTTSFLCQYGFKRKNELQFIDGIYIYPNDFFNPMNDYTGKVNITPNTHSIHYFAKSWIKGYSPLRNYLTRKFHLFYNKISQR